MGQYPRAALIYKILDKVIRNNMFYTRGTIDVSRAVNRAFLLLIDIVKAEHNMPLYNEMKMFAINFNPEHDPRASIDNRTKALIMMVTQFTVYFIYSIFYDLYKYLHPRNTLMPLGSKFELNKVLSYKEKKKYYLTKEEKRIVQLALFGFNNMEFNSFRIKNLSENVINYLRRFR